MAPYNDESNVNFVSVDNFGGTRNVMNNARINLDGPADTKPSTFGEASLIRAGSTIYRGSTFGRGLHVGHNVLIRENCTIGKNCSIGSYSILEHSVALENNVRIHSRCFLPEFTYIEEDAWIGPCVVFTNSKYPNRMDSKSCLQGVVVKKGAIIGANSTILPGVIIGPHAIIGAGSVVTKSVRGGVVVYGNPACEKC